MDKSKGKQFNKTFTIFSLILLGSIGSGLWDLFFKDALFFIGEIFVRIAFTIYSGYFDFLYGSVGRQPEPLLIYLPGIAIITVVILLPVFAYFMINRLYSRIDSKLSANNDSSDGESKISNYIFYIFQHHRNIFKAAYIIPLILMSILYTSILIKSSSNINAINSIERRMAIVRPYFAEQKYHELVSQFRLVDSRNALQEIIDDIEVIAKNNDIDLPELNLYGIEVSDTQDDADKKRM